MFNITAQVPHWTLYLRGVLFLFLLFLFCDAVVSIADDQDGAVRQHRGQPFPVPALPC